MIYVLDPAEKKTLSLYQKRPDGKLIDRYNLSEDWRYETVKVKTSRFTHAKGTVTLVHALPAIMLHPTYYKPLMTVKELRSHHRPSVKFPINEICTFSRVKAIKKSLLKNIDPTACMKSPKDLTLKDTSKFLLMEYTVMFIF